LVDLDLHAGRDPQRICSRHSDEKLLLVLALDLADGGGNQHHSGIGLEALMIGEANLLVLGLLAFHAKLDPSLVGCCGVAGSASGTSSGSSSGSRSGRGCASGSRGTGGGRAGVWRGRALVGGTTGPSATGTP